MIEQNLYHLMSTREVSKGRLLNEHDFVLNLEVLNGCAHHCTGCFVNRRNRIDDVNLDTALEIATDLTNHGMRFREVILSPTDLFSADNAEEILLNETFQKLMQLYPKTRITSTAMFDNMDWDRFLRVFEILDNSELYRSDMILEFLVPINPQKILSNDIQYLANYNRFINYLKNETPKVVDWSFVVNVYHDADFVENFDELTKRAKEQFDTTIEFLPSFFRTEKDDIIEEQLNTWKTFLDNVVNEDNYRTIQLTIADPYHNASNTIVMNYKKNQLFLSPFVYEQIIQTSPKYLIEQPTAQAVLDHSHTLMLQQYQYVSKTAGCGVCPYLSTCIGRNVLTLMEQKNITRCVYPKAVLDLYMDVDSRSARVQRCEDAFNN